MAFSQYRLTTKDMKKGVWLNEKEIVDLIKICRTRNRALYKKLVESYEYLENKKFNSKNGMEKIVE